MFLRKYFCGQNLTIYLFEGICSYSLCFLNESDKQQIHFFNRLFNITLLYNYWTQVVNLSV